MGYPRPYPIEQQPAETVEAYRARLVQGIRDSVVYAKTSPTFDKTAAEKISELVEGVPLVSLHENINTTESLVWLHDKIGEITRGNWQPTCAIGSPKSDDSLTRPSSDTAASLVRSWDLAIDVAIAAIKAGSTTAQATSKAIAEFKKNFPSATEAEIDGLTEAISGFEFMAAKSPKKGRKYAEDVWRALLTEDFWLKLAANPFACKSEGTRRLSIALLVASLCAWFSWLAIPRPYALPAYGSLRSYILRSEWLPELHVPIVGFLVARVATMAGRWIIKGFKADKNPPL